MVSAVHRDRHEARSVGEKEQSLVLMVKLKYNVKVHMMEVDVEKVDTTSGMSYERFLLE